MILFGSIEIGEKNGSTHRIYSRIESPLYRHFNKNSFTTKYWPESDRSMGIQSVVKTSSR